MASATIPRDRSEIVVPRVCHIPCRRAGALVGRRALSGNLHAGSDGWVIDLVYLRYMAPMMSGRVVDYIIERSLRPGAQPEEIITGMRNLFAVPSGGAGEA